MKCPSNKQHGSMIANVYSNGKHTRLQVMPSDLEELVGRCGWTVINDLEGVTDEGRKVIDTLQQQDSVIVINSGVEWWQQRVISAEPCLTPDM